MCRGFNTLMIFEQKLKIIKYFIATLAKYVLGSVFILLSLLVCRSALLAHVHLASFVHCLQKL